MKLPRRNFLHLAVDAVALLALSRIARAQAYPTRPVRWDRRFFAGRLRQPSCPPIAQWLSKRLGQQLRTGQGRAPILPCKRQSIHSRTATGVAVATSTIRREGLGEDMVSLIQDP